jgi:predicted RNA-binding protein with TRAM domain
MTLLVKNGTKEEKWVSMKLSSIQGVGFTVFVERDFKEGEFVTVLIQRHYSNQSI